MAGRGLQGLWGQKGQREWNWARQRRPARGLRGVRGEGAAHATGHDNLQKSAGDFWGDHDGWWRQAEMKRGNFRDPAICAQGVRGHTTSSHRHPRVKILLMEANMFQAKTKGR